MERSYFTIAVSCLVCQHDQGSAASQRIRCGGFAPALTDEEVTASEICGGDVKGGADKDSVTPVQALWQADVLRPRDRGRFVRRAATPWQAKKRIQRRLTGGSGQAWDEAQVIDTLPLPPPRR